SVNTPSLTGSAKVGLASTMVAKAPESIIDFIFMFSSSQIINVSARLAAAFRNQSRQIKLVGFVRCGPVGAVFLINGSFRHPQAHGRAFSDGLREALGGFDRATGR